MTSASSPAGSDGLSVVVVARDALVRSLLLKVLGECRIPVSEWTREELAHAVEKPDVVCASPSVAAHVLALGVPTVVVTRGLSVSDEAWAELAHRRPVVLRHDDLTPVTLLEGLLSARFGIDVTDVPSSLSQVPLALLRGFLGRPRAFRTIRDAARACGCSAAELRAVERKWECRRFEELVTRLRAGTWRWLRSAGVDRSVVEDHLGIKDRSDFRRACRRARIPVPWSGNERT